MLARIAQLADIFADARAMVDSGSFHVAILGDMNTMAHGIARLSPNYCCDRMRFLTLGRDEGVIWERAVLAQHDQRYNPANDADRTAAAAASSQEHTQTDVPIRTAESNTNNELSLNQHDPGAITNFSNGTIALPAESSPLPLPPINTALVRWGLAPEFARDAVNPGFACPFAASETITLDNPAYRWFGLSLMKGKLDWVLLRRVRWVKKDVGNLNYELSDHRWLLVEAVLE